VAESPFAFECETTHVIRLHPRAPGGPNVVIGRVVHLRVDDDLVNDRWHVDAERLAAIGRMGGIGYTRTRERFEMPSGRASLDRDPGLG
jgi:flavin reductase (DIM6/NTAB) family NADH-FMN oxidoreductase RutF